MLHTIADLIHAGVPPTRPPDVKIIGQMMQHEPPTWSGVVYQGDVIPYWDLSRPRLRPFNGVATGQSYLARLEELVGLEEPAAAEVIVLSSMALPDAFDHLDLAWQLITGTHLLKLPRAAMAANLTQPVNSVEEFQSRLSALADLLNCMDVPKPSEPGWQGGTLLRLRVWLQERLGEGSGPALEAVGKLQNIVSVRTRQQHSGSAQKGDRAWVDLGLARFGSDWAGAWTRIRVTTITSLTTIRESLNPLLDDLTALAI